MGELSKSPSKWESQHRVLGCGALKPMLFILRPPATLASCTNRSRNQGPERGAIWPRPHSKLGAELGPELHFLNGQSGGPSFLLAEMGLFCPGWP